MSTTREQITNYDTKWISLESEAYRIAAEADGKHFRNVNHDTKRD